MCDSGDGVTLLVPVYEAHRGSDGVKGELSICVAGVPPATRGVAN